MATEMKIYRVSIWEGRKPSGSSDSQYTTGDESLAWKSLYDDLAAAGEGSWGKVEQLHGAKCALYATQKDGKGVPRRFVR